MAKVIKALKKLGKGAKKLKSAPAPPAPKPQVDQSTSQLITAEVNKRKKFKKIGKRVKKLIGG